MTPLTIHANCVIIGPIGLLIRGAPGSGKTGLSDALIGAARSMGHFAALVSDDRTVLARKGIRLLASPPERLAGLMEVRWHGIVEVDYEPAACIRFVVDLVSETELDRLPEHAVTTIVLEGVEVPSASISASDLSMAFRRVRWALKASFPEVPPYI